MNKAYVYNGIKFKYPELAEYISLITDRQRQGLYRESFLYMRLAEEYIIEILAKINGLSLMDINKDVPDMYSYRSIYSLSEELYNKGKLTFDEKNAHDNIRKYANAALHRGVDAKFFEKIWSNCYEDVFFVASFLIDEKNEFKNDNYSVYTEGDFMRRMQDEFSNQLSTNTDLVEAIQMFTQRIRLNTMDVDKAKSVVDYFVQAIKGGTLPMLALSYSIKMSQR